MSGVLPITPYLVFEIRSLMNWAITIWLDWMDCQRALDIHLQPHSSYRHMSMPSFLCGCWGPELTVCLTQGVISPAPFHS